MSYTTFLGRCIDAVARTSIDYNHEMSQAMELAKFHVDNPDVIIEYPLLNTPERQERLYGDIISYFIPENS